MLTEINLNLAWIGNYTYCFWNVINYTDMPEDLAKLPLMLFMYEELDTTVYVDVITY